MKLFFLVLSSAAALAGQTCRLAISPSSVGVREHGGILVVSIRTPDVCPWSIATNAPWLVANTASGSGAAAVMLTAAPNTGSVRSAVLLINGQPVTVTQAGPGGSGCWFVLSPPGMIVAALGQIGTIGITPGRSQCAWTAQSHARWVQVFPLSGSGRAIAEYTVFPNFSTADRSGILNIGAQVFAVTQSGGTGTANERFVSMMYFNFLGRLPTVLELVQQVATLDAGASRTDLVMRVFNSPEFNLGGRFIAGLYVGILKRDAEFSGWLFQRNALATGRANQSQLVENFVNSAEFGLRFGTPNDSDFVRLLYRNVLLREPSNAEVAFHQEALRTGLSRVNLAENFLNSSEFRNGTDPRLVAFLLYTALLGRDPSSGDLTLRIAQLQGGMPVRTLVDQFINSPEFLAQVQ